MDQVAFEKETSICREMYQKQRGCKWGKCDTCGVIPMLYKLHKGILIEEADEIKRVKEEVFGEKQ